MSHETIEELTFSRDGSQAYRYSGEDVAISAAGSWEYANAEVPDMEWVAEPDLEEDSDAVLIDPEALAELVRLARIGAEYAGCSTCRRVTRV